MKDLGRSKRLRNHDQSGDSSQENKGEDSLALADNDADDDDEEEEDVDVDHARPRKCAPEGPFSLADLNRLALKPGLTAKELASAFWNLQGRLEEDDPERREPKDTFVNNIIRGKNLEVFLEVDKSLRLGKGMMKQLLFAAVRVGDEDAVVRLVFLLHRRCFTELFDLVSRALRIHPPYEAPHLGARGLVGEIVRLKVVKRGNKAVTTTYTCKDFIANFNVLRCSRHALIAMDEVLGPEVWDEVRHETEIAADSIKSLINKDMDGLARSGVLEFLLRHNALALSPELCSSISKGVKNLPWTFQDVNNPHIHSLIDFYNEAFLPIINETSKQEMKAIPMSDFVRDVGRCIIRYSPAIKVATLKEDSFLDWIENHLSSRDSRVSLETEELICLYMWTGAVDRLHSLLELHVPAERSCTVREDGLLVNEPRPSPNVVKIRARMVLDAVQKHRGAYRSQYDYAGLPVQHYLFHELELDIEQVCNYCKYHVIYLGPTSPPTLVDKVLQMVHANVPELESDKWKELFRQDVYPVPAYFGGQVKEIYGSPGLHPKICFRKSLNCPHVNTYLICGARLSTNHDRETLEYLRPWYRVCSTMLNQETKFSMDDAMQLCWQSDCRAQALVEADLLNIDDLLCNTYWRQIKEGSLLLSRESQDWLPLYLNWCELTLDQDVKEMLHAVVFAIACATGRINQAKRALLQLLHPPAGHDPWAKMSIRRSVISAIAARTRSLPFVKWVLSQIQVAFSREPSEQTTEILSRKGTQVDGWNYQLNMTAWLRFMLIMIPVDEFSKIRALFSTSPFYDRFLYLADYALYPPCPKYLLETCFLLAQTDPLAVLPLICRIIMIDRSNIEQWTRYDGVKFGFYDSPLKRNVSNSDDVKEEEGEAEEKEKEKEEVEEEEEEEEEESGTKGNNAAWAWTFITLVKLIELIADETNGIADTILNAKEQMILVPERVEGSRALCVPRNLDS